MLLHGIKKQPVSKIDPLRRAEYQPAVPLKLHLLSQIPLMGSLPAALTQLARERSNSFRVLLSGSGATDRLHPPWLAPTATSLGWVLQKILSVKAFSQKSYHFIV